MSLPLGLKPLAKITAYTSAGVDPAFMGLGPIPAVRKILQQTGLSFNDFGSSSWMKRSRRRPSTVCESRSSTWRKRTSLEVAYPLATPLVLPEPALSCLLLARWCVTAWNSDWQLYVSVVGREWPWFLKDSETSGASPMADFEIRRAPRQFAGKWEVKHGS